MRIISISASLRHVARHAGSMDSRRPLPSADADADADADPLDLDGPCARDIRPAPTMATSRPTRRDHALPGHRRHHPMRPAERRVPGKYLLAPGTGADYSTRHPGNTRETPGKHPGNTREAPRARLFSPWGFIMACSTLLPPVQLRLDSTTTTKKYTWFTGWMPCMAIDDASAPLHLSGVLGALRAQVAYQLAVMRTDKPSAPVAVGSQQTANTTTLRRTSPPRRRRPETPTSALERPTTCPLLRTRVSRRRRSTSPSVSAAATRRPGTATWRLPYVMDGIYREGLCQRYTGGECATPAF
jgi:hypothetical protein